MTIEGENKDSLLIESILRLAMARQRPPIGDELAELLHWWRLWIGDRGPSCSFNDWHVRFLRWALQGRVEMVQMWARERGTPEARGALTAIQTVHDFGWPNGPAAHFFHMLWGWLQLELRKPGTRTPPTVQEQIESLKAHAEENGQRIKKWHINGPCVTAQFEPPNKRESPD